jgi:hypothetical protein
VAPVLTNGESADSLESAKSFTHPFPQNTFGENGQLLQLQLAKVNNWCKFVAVESRHGETVFAELAGAALAESNAENIAARWDVIDAKGAVAGDRRREVGNDGTESLIRIVG